MNVRASLLNVFAIAMVLAITGLMHAAVITWQTGPTYNGPAGFTAIDTSGQAVEAVNIGDAPGPLTVDPGPGGLNLTFFSRNQPLNQGPFNSGSPGTTDAAWNSIIDRTDWNNVNASFPNFLSGLTAGRDYQVQLFASDARGCCSTRTQFFSDGMGNDSPTITQGDFTSVIGTFTADGATQEIGLSASSTDPVLSAYVLRDVTPGLPAANGLVGNALNDRAAASDGAATVLYSNWVHAPIAGTVDAVEVFGQGSTNTFNFYVLRNTGTKDQYEVVYDSGTIAPSGTGVQSLSFPNGPVDVQAGDVFAHYGRGIPFSGGTQAGAINPQGIYFSAPAAPAEGNNIQLASAAFPLRNDLSRDYASAVRLGGIVEQVGFGTFDGNTVDGATGVTGVLDDHGFTKAGQVTHWHIWSDVASRAGLSVTPMLFEADGQGGYVVVGIGAPGVSDGSGLQMFEFELVEGTDLVGPGIFPGWWDGNHLTGAANQGVIEWKNNLGSGLIPLFPDVDGFALGDTLGGPNGQNPFGTSPFRRAYAINFTTQVIPVPEPVSASLLVMAGAALLRRRRATRN